MNADRTLDTILGSLNIEDDAPKLHEEVKKLLPIEISDKELRLALDKLELDGFVGYMTGKTGGEPNDVRQYHITFDGKVFLESSWLLKNQPYRSNTWRQRLRVSYRVLATALIVLNSVVIALISFWGVKVADRSNRMEKLYQLESEKAINQRLMIDSLTTRIEILEKEKIQQPTKPKAN